MGPFDRNGPTTGQRRDTLAILGTIASRTTTDLGQLPTAAEARWMGSSAPPIAAVPGLIRSYNIKAYGVKEDAALPEDSGTVFLR